MITLHKFYLFTTPQKQSARVVQDKNEKNVNASLQLKNLQLQLRAQQTAPLVNKHYENEVTLRQQNQS